MRRASASSRRAHDARIVQLMLIPAAELAGVRRGPNCAPLRSIDAQATSSPAPRMEEVITDIARRDPQELPKLPVY